VEQDWKSSRQLSPSIRAHTEQLHQCYQLLVTGSVQVQYCSLSETSRPIVIPLLTATYHSNISQLLLSAYDDYCMETDLQTAISGIMYLLQKQRTSF